MQRGELGSVFEIVRHRELIPQLRVPGREKLFRSASRRTQCLQRGSRHVLPLIVQTPAAFIARRGESGEIVRVARFEMLQRSQKSVVQLRCEVGVLLVDAFQPKPLPLLVREMESARLIVEPVVPALAQRPRIAADLLPSSVQHLRGAGVRGLDALGFGFEARVGFLRANISEF